MESTSNFKPFEKNMIVIVNVLPILQTVKNLVGPLSEKRRVRISFDSEKVKGSQTLVKPGLDHFHDIFHYSEGRRFGKYLP